MNEAGTKYCDHQVIRLPRFDAKLNEIEAAYQTTKDTNCGQ